MSRVGPQLLAMVLTAGIAYGASTTVDAPSPRGGGPDSTRPVYPWSAPAGWDVTLAPRQEPGPRMIMSGRVFGFDSLPASGVTLYVYHADGKGRYARRAGDLNRIAGVLRTNARGQFRIRSVLPGQYEGEPHVHFEVWDDHRPKSATFVGLFAAPGVPPVPTWKHTRGARREYGSHMALFTLDSNGVYRSRHDLWLGTMVPVDARYDSVMRAARERVEAAPPR